MLPESTGRLNDLGNAFERAAKRTPDDATTEKLRYYGIAEKYFLKRGF